MWWKVRQSRSCSQMGERPASVAGNAELECCVVWVVSRRARRSRTRSCLEMDVELRRMRKRCALSAERSTPPQIARWRASDRRVDAAPDGARTTSSAAHSWSAPVKTIANCLTDAKSTLYKRFTERMKMIRRFIDLLCSGFDWHDARGDALRAQVFHEARVSSYDMCILNNAWNKTIEHLNLVCQEIYE